MMKITRLHALLGASLLLTCVLLLALHIDRNGRVTAQPAESFTLKQVLSSPFPTELIAAPKGERIAWAFDAEGKRNVWAAEGPEFKAHQLTAYNEDTGQELTELSFSADGRWVVYVRGGEANAAGDVPNPASDPAGAEQAVFAVSFENGKVRRIGEGEHPVVSPVDGRVLFLRDNLIWIASLDRDQKPQPLFAARGANISPAWSPDGKQVAFNSSRNTHSFIAVYDFEKQSIQYIVPSVDRDSTPRWSPDGKRLAFIRMPARGNQPRSPLVDTPNPWAIWTADVATGAAREVWRSGNTLDDSLPSMAGEDVLQWAKGWHSDDLLANDLLVFASEKDGWLRLYGMEDARGGELPFTPPNSEFEQVTMTPDRKRVIFSSNRFDTDRRALWIGYPGRGASSSITVEGKVSWGPVVTGDGKFIAYMASDERQPASLYVMPLNPAPIGRDVINPKEPYRQPYKATGEARAIATETLPKDFPAAQLVTPQSVTFKAADGLEIHGQLYLPKNAKPSGNGAQCQRERRPCAIA